MKDSSISKFFEKSRQERLEIVKNFSNLSDEELKLLESNDGGISFEKADNMVENAIGTFSLPLGIATNFKINGKDYVIPMVIEEPSVMSLLVPISAPMVNAESYSFGFDSHPIVINESSGITYYDSTTVGDGIIRTIQVQMTAPCYSGSFLIELSEDVRDDGYYYSPKISFVRSSNCNGITPPGGLLSSDFDV